MRNYVIYFTIMTIILVLFFIGVIVVVAHLGQKIDVVSKKQQRLEQLLTGFHKETLNKLKNGNRNESLD